MYLSTKNGGRSWVLKYTNPVTGKPEQIGGGSLEKRPLNEARKWREQMYGLLVRGIDPKANRAKVKPSEKTFGQTCDAYMVRYRHSDRWGERIRREWVKSLALRHCLHIRELPISQILKPQVLECLEPLKSPYTQENLRMRIWNVLKEAIARGEHPGPNPADSAAIGVFLKPKPPTRHTASMEWRVLPDFIQSIRARPCIGSLALEFQILTCVRPSESRESEWEEFNDDEALWIIPPERMKQGERHRVPLSPRAREIIREVRAMGMGSKYVFASTRRVGSPISRDVLDVLLPDYGRNPRILTLHGFRSTWREWAQDHEISYDLAELALAHKIGGQVERSYLRGDGLARRRPLMEAWTNFCGNVDGASNVIPFASNAS